MVYFNNEERPRFDDRVAAGRMLAAALTMYEGKNALVLGIPRGGLPVAAEIAKRIDGELDIVVARKLGAPFSPELAIGAVTAHGGRYLNRDLIRELEIDDEYVESATKRESEEARRREMRFRGAPEPAEAHGRVVIIVDDGLATGATMRATVDWLKHQHPRELVVAVPVGSGDACEQLAPLVGVLVCPYRPEPFYAVGLFYENFAPVTDEDVVSILEQERARRERKRSAPLTPRPSGVP